MNTAAHGTARGVATALVAGLLAGLLAGPAAANDWPSWRGRAQTGVSDVTGLVSSWSPEGENLIWYDRWVGRSTPAVFDGRVCANGRTGDGVDKQEVVACWNAETGEKLWQHNYNVLNTTVPFNRVGWGSVTGDPETGYLYAMNIDGHLNAFDRDGAVVWSWRLAEELGRASGYGGRTSTPLVDEDQLLLSIIGAGWGNLGGPPRHRYFGFDKMTGEVRWHSTPGGNVADMNTQSVGVVGVVDGQRLWIDGNADGHIYALNARTGRTVWQYQLSKRGINVSPVLDGDTVYAAHSEENLDSGIMGRVVAIDATGEGDVTATHERWRADELAVGFSSPLLHDGRLYVIDNSANLFALDAESGAVAWEQSVGTVGKASPVWADGKLFVTETNGNVTILEPGPDGATELDHDELAVEDGRYAEIYGSFAVGYGRLYVTAESGIYAIGDPDAPFAAAAGTAPEGPAEAAPHGRRGQPAGGSGGGHRDGRRHRRVPRARLRRERPVPRRTGRDLVGRRARGGRHLPERRPRHRRTRLQPGGHGDRQRRGAERGGPGAGVRAPAVVGELRERTPAALDRRRRQPRGRRPRRRPGVPEGALPHRHPPPRHLPRPDRHVRLHGAGRRQGVAVAPAAARRRAHQQRLHDGRAGQPAEDPDPVVGGRAAHPRGGRLHVGRRRPGTG